MKLSKYDKNVIKKKKEFVNLYVSCNKEMYGICLH